MWEEDKEENKRGGERRVKKGVEKKREEKKMKMVDQVRCGDVRRGNMIWYDFMMYDVLDVTCKESQHHLDEVSLVVVQSVGPVVSV